MRCTYDTTGRTGLTYVSSWGTCLTDSHFKPDMIFFFFNLSIHSFTHCRWEFVFFVLFFLLHYVFFKYVINIRTVYSDNYFNLAGWWINNWRNVSKFSSVLPQASWWKCSHFLFQHSQSGKFSEWVCNLCYYVRLYYTKSNLCKHGDILTCSEQKNVKANQLSTSSSCTWKNSNELYAYQ